jgi:hypothetical protein
VTSATVLRSRDSARPGHGDAAIIAPPATTGRRERMVDDGRPHEERLEVPSSCCAEDDHDHPQRDPGPVVDEGEEDGERARDDRTDERHERAEEDEDADRDRERHPERKHRADADRVDGRDEELRRA